MRPGLEYRGCQASMWATVGWVVLCIVLSICETGAEKVEKKQIYLAGTFPISGSEGWQGGQVGYHVTIKPYDWTGQLRLDCHISY